MHGDADREAAIREPEGRFCAGCGSSDWPWNCPTACPVGQKFSQLLAELAAAREREAKLREALRADVQLIADAYYGGNERDLNAADGAIQRLFALADGEGET